MDKEIVTAINKALENQTFVTEVKTVTNRLRSEYDEKRICKPLDVLSINKKLGLDPLHEIGFLIAYYNEL